MRNSLQRSAYSNQLSALRFHLGFALLLVLVVFAGARAEGFDEQRAWEHLIAQCSLGPRVPGSPEHTKCIELLTAELEKCGAFVERQDFWGLNPVSGEAHKLSNIIGRLYPERSRYVLLCAHWDTRPWADQDADSAQWGRPIMGANDGASGVAVILEIARCLSLEDPGIGVQIAFFDGEDMGRQAHLVEYLLGSREYVRTLRVPYPEAAILLDMVGDADLQIPYEEHSRHSVPRLLEEVFAVAHQLGEYAFKRQPGPAVYDDHIPLLGAGIPAIDLVDFDYPYWHTSQDTPENCSPQSLGAVGRVVLEWIYRRGDKKP
jgi:hypothetical protein